MPGAPDDVMLTVTSNQSASFTFTKPGVYHCYCPVHADYDKETQQFAAHKDADAFPEAMEGFVIVVS